LLCREWGFRLEDVGYVFRSELILALRKEARPAAVRAPAAPAVDAARSTGT
jgi:hypothetical protein